MTDRERLLMGLNAASPFAMEPGVVQALWLATYAAAFARHYSDDGPGHIEIMREHRGQPPVEDAAAVYRRAVAAKARVVADEAVKAMEEGE